MEANEMCFYLQNQISALSKWDLYAALSKS